MRDSDNLASDICKYLKKIRVYKGKTIKDISEASGLSTPAVFNLESSQCNPKLETLTKYLEVLEIDLSAVIIKGLDSIYNINEKEISKVRDDALPLPKEKGIKWIKNKNKWRLSVYFNGRNIVLGYYDEFHEAKQSRLQADMDISKYNKKGKLPNNTLIRHESISQDMYEVDSFRKSGVVGVHWDKNRSKWRAKIKVNGKEIALGSYPTIEEATEVRRLAEIEYFGNTVDNLYVKTDYKNNKSGTIGVHWDKRRKRWRANISYMGKSHSLGVYKNIEDAENIRKLAEQKIIDGTFLEWYNNKYFTVSGRGRSNAKHILVCRTHVGRISNPNAYSNSQTGIRGVFWDKQHNKWRARINFQKQVYELGFFDNIEDAKKVRKRAEEKIYGNFLEWYRKTYQDEEL